MKLEISENGIVWDENQKIIGQIDSDLDIKTALNLLKTLRLELPRLQGIAQGFDDCGYNGAAKLITEITDKLKDVLTHEKAA